MTLKFALVLLFLCFIAAVHSGTFVLHMTCAPCTISCGYSSCYRLYTDAGDYDQQVCSTFNCPSSFSIDMTVSSCTASTSGTTCTSGLCLSSAQMSMCSGGYSYCSPSFWVYTNCGSCSSSTTCSGKCFSTSSSLSSGTTQTCYGSTCNGISSMNTTIAPCSSGTDIFGSTCTCCMTINANGNAEGVGLSMCAESNNLFSSSNFTTYAKSKTSSQGFVVMALMLLFIISTAL